MTDSRAPGAVESIPTDWARLDDDPGPPTDADVAAFDVELRPGDVLDVGAHGDVIVFVVAGSVVCQVGEGERTLRAGDSMFVQRGDNRISYTADEVDDIVDDIARLFVVNGLG